MTTKIKAGVIGDGVVGTTQIAANAVTSAKLAQNSVLTKHIDDNQIGIDQLSVSDGSDGQALTTNGSGTLSFATVGVSGISSSADATAITIDSSERIGMPAIGQTHPVGGQAKLGINADNAAGASLSIHRHYAGVFGGYLVFQKSRNTDITNLGVVSDNDILGSIEFTGADGNSYAQGAHIRALVDGTPGDGDMPTRLIFSTSADGSGTPTERMRITNNGAIKMPSSVFSQTDKYNLFTNDQAGEFVQILEHQHTSSSDGSGPHGMQISFTGVAPNQTNRYFFRCGDSSALRIIIDSQGNITNQNGSYGQISDEKLKENIVDATTKLDGLMQLEIKNFNFIGDDKKQLGVIAQQVETIFPNLIDERKDTHPTTNEDLGTTTKSVKYSVFVPMLIKAMQEQQTIINDLKSRIETLER